MTIAKIEYHLSERFEVAFNQIHRSLKYIVKIREDKFKVLLDVGARRHHLIGKYHSDLTQYAKLRNSLVHDKRKLGYYIAEPHIDVVTHIEKIAELLNRPNYALSIATREVISFDFESSILIAFQEIKKHGYSQYPVYDNNKYVGLLQTGDIVKWISENIVNTVLDICEVKVSDIIADVNDHPIEFVKKSIDIFEVEELYENKHKERIDLEAVIITENGKRNETPLGLITAWDLIEIDYTAD